MTLVEIHDWKLWILMHQMRNQKGWVKEVLPLAQKRMDVINKARSRSYNPATGREKVLDIFVCPCPPNKNGFCTLPQNCIAKRMWEQGGCDIVCKAMQELRAAKDGE